MWVRNLPPDTSAFIVCCKVILTILFERACLLYAKNKILNMLHAYYVSNGVVE